MKFGGRLRWKIQACSQILNLQFTTQERLFSIDCVRVRSHFKYWYILVYGEELKKRQGTR